MRSTIVFFLLFISISLDLHSQILEPVKWTTSVEKTSDSEYVLVATASIDPGWHLYSQNVPENGPIPTAFTFENNEQFKLVETVTEETGKTVDDPVFGMKIKYFESKTDFKQRIKIINKELSVVKGEVEFMVCDDERCLPPSYVDLVFDIYKARTGVESSMSGGVFNFQ